MANKEVKKEIAVIRQFSKELEVSDKFVGKSKKTDKPFYVATMKGWGHESKHFLTEEEYHRLALGERKIFDFELAEKLRDGFWSYEPRLVFPPMSEKTEEL